MGAIRRDERRPMRQHDPKTGRFIPAREETRAVLDQMVADAEEDDLYTRTDGPAPPTREPKELGPERVDITGREPVLVRDWDHAAVLNALFMRQPDIIEAELSYLTQPGTARANTWAKRARRRFFWSSDEIAADIVRETIAKCQLDNVPATIEYEEVVA